MKQVRKGRYTRHPSVRSRIQRPIIRFVAWFRGLSWPKKIALITTPILAFLIIVPIATYAYYARDIADQERLMNRNNTGVVFTDRNGESFYSVGRAEHRDIVRLNDMSPSLKDALIASEDKNFYEHSGFSILSIFRAAFTGYGGGSTISQQLAKNTLLSSERSLLRKYQELFMSIAIERNYTKDQILEMYLNSVYFGENTFGVEDAAEAYYDKKPRDLSLAESAMLIGLLPAPSAYSPISGNADYARERQETVLGRMVANGYVTETEKQNALDEKIAYAKQNAHISEAPHFAEMVMAELDEKYGHELVMRSGYQVKTTLDIEMQRTLQNSVDANMSFIEANNGSNASAVAIDPKTGEVRALVGSADYTNKKWGAVNMVTTARQPGSSFKPIYYSAALAEGAITPATPLEDKAINLSGWQPQNADRRFRGTVTVRQALNWSLNIPSIVVMQKLGIKKSVQAAQQMGISSIDPERDYGLSLSLGSAEVPLLEMTNAYAGFANQGTQYTTTIVSSIKDKFDTEIYVSKRTGRQAISPTGAFLISDILSDATTRSSIFGSSLTVDGKMAAVKTGTTDENRDAWTIGYTPSLAIGVWVGNNDNTPMYNGGSGMAGPIWRTAMGQMLADKADEKFVVPEGIVQRSTCYSNFGLATNDIREGTFLEYYLSTALPSVTCEPEEIKEIKVCVLESGDLRTIREDEFDEKKHSKDVDDCNDDIPIEDESIEEDPETLVVCNLATGETMTIPLDEYEESLYSDNLTECEEVPDPEELVSPAVP